MTTTNLENNSLTADVLSALLFAATNNEGDGIDPIDEAIAIAVTRYYEMADGQVNPYDEDIMTLEENLKLMTIARDDLLKSHQEKSEAMNRHYKNWITAKDQLKKAHDREEALGNANLLLEEANSALQDEVIKMSKLNEHHLKLWNIDQKKLDLSRERRTKARGDLWKCHQREEKLENQLAGQADLLKDRNAEINELREEVSRLNRMFEIEGENHRIKDIDLMGAKKRIAELEKEVVAQNGELAVCEKQLAEANHKADYFAEGEGASELQEEIDNLKLQVTRADFETGNQMRQAERWRRTADQWCKASAAAESEVAELLSTARFQAAHVKHEARYISDRLMDIRTKIDHNLDEPVVTILDPIEALVQTIWERFDLDQ